MPRSPRIVPAISALRSARKRWRGPIATIALFAMMAGGFALVRASAGDRFASFQWPESLSRIFGSRTTRTLSRPEPMPVAGTENDFFQNTSMNTLGNYTLGLPTNIQDVLLTTSGTALTIAGAPTTRNMGSLDQTNNNAYTIRNSTGTANNSTLNLGGGGTTNSIAGSNGSDLIFLGGTTSSLTIQGPNTDGGTGVLNTVVLADGNFDVANSGATLNLSSILSGNFNLTKSGAGKLTLSGANTFGAGKTFTLQAGTLNINSSTALGAATNTFQINGGTIDNTSGAAITLSNNNAQTWNGDFTFTGGSGTTHDLDFGLGAVSLGTAAGTTRTITTSAGTLITRGIISNGTTANSLTKTGAGTLKLYGASTYSGTTIVNNGTLSLQGSLSSSTIQIDSGATFGTIGLTLQNSQTLKGTATAGQGVINCESPPNCLTMGSTSSLSLAYASGNPTLTVSGTGVFTLQSGNAVTVTNTGSALAAGDYKLISKTGPGAVDGTAPTSVDVVSSATPGVPGSGLAAGTAASLVITGGELFLHVVSTGNTISGALNAGINSSGKTITLLKNGVIVGSNVTGGGATFSFSGVSYNSGDILTVFVDNDASVKGATVTRGSSGDLTGLNIDQNTLTVRHEDAGPITNANLATGNNGDSDLTAVYSVSGSNLTIGSSMTLAVASGKTFTPGGDVTTTNLSNAGTLNAGSGIISISGTFTNTGTFNADTSTVDYNGSVSQVVIALQYYNLTVSNNRSGGSVTFTNGGTVAIGHLFNPTATNVSYDLDNNTIEYNGTDTSTVLGSNFNNYHNLKINRTNVSGFPGLVVINILEVVKEFTSASDYHHVVIDGTGTLSLSNDITVSGDWTNNGTFTHNGKRVTFDGSGPQMITTGGTTAGKDFGPVTINKGGGSTATLAGDFKDTTLTITAGVLDQGASFLLSSGAISVAPGATWKDIGSGDITLSGGVTNSGTININGGTDVCGETQEIVIGSSGGLQPWSGTTGNFTIKDVHVSNQGGTALIHVENGADDGGNGVNWIFTPATCTGGTLYVWNPPAPGTDSSYTTAINWTPTRASQSVDDVLVVDNAFTPTTTITDVPNQTIGRFRVINGAFATLTSAAATTLTIKGEGSSVPDLDVAGSSRLILSGSNTLTISLPSGANGNIDNLLTIEGSGNRLIAADANAVTFPAATACTVETGYTGNPFGTAASGAGAGSIVFLSGSTYTHKAGSSPFGAATDASIVTFMTGSTARWLTNSGFQASGRIYADLQIGDATTEAVVADPCATPVNTCTGNFAFQNLTIWNNVGSTYPKLTFVGSGASTVTIRGNITSNGGTGNFQDINLSGGTGGIVIDKPGSTVTFSDNSGGFRGIEFESDARLTGTTTLTLQRKILMGQSPPPTFVLSVPIDATLNGGPDAYVIGKLLKNFDGSNTTQTFQVGDVVKYSPIVVSNSSGTGTLTINARTPKHPSISGTNALGRYWQIDNAGLASANLAFHYPGTDVPGTATESNFKFFRYSGGTFTPFNVSSLDTTDANDHIATLTGVTQFSDWTLAEPAAVGETNVTLSGGNLVISDANGGNTNDTLTLSLVAGPNIRVNDPINTLSCGAGMTQFDANTCDIPQGSVTGNIQVNTLGGNDALTINYSGGNPLPAAGLAYAGGLGATDVLTVTGGSAANITHTFANANDGSVNINGTVISYTGLEPVTDNMAAVDRVFTFTGGSELITLSDAAGANMTIDSTLSESVTFANPTGSLTINGGTGDDTITIASVDANGPFNVDLTINGDDGGDVVNLNADITFAAGENLDVNLTNDAGSGDVDAINVGTNANHVLSGAGAATLAGSYYIAMASGSSVTTVDGAITLNANTAGLTSGNFVGIDVNGATIQSTGTGNVTLTGKGGSAASSQYGVRVIGGGDIIGGTTGTATINGTGRGTGAGSNNSGVFVTGAGSSISSNGASVQVTGTGGLGTLSSGINMLSGGLITAGGSGNVTLNATGGGVSGTGAFNHGIIMGGATINSAGGNVSVTGTGGAGTGSTADFTGCQLEDSTITAASSGTVTVNCTAGTAPTSQTLVGLDVRFTSQITSSGGNVSVTGTGGNTTSTLISAGAGVRLIGNGTITAGGTGTVTVTGSGVGGSTTGHEGVVVSGFGLNTNLARIGSAGATTITAASGNGASHALALGISNSGRITTSSDSPVTINADSVNFGAGAIVSSGTGATTIRQRTAGTLINLGGADVLSGSPFTLGLTDAELDLVTAGTLNIGDASSGAITFSGATPIDVTDGPNIATVNLVTGGAINSNSTPSVLDILAAALNLTSVTGIDIEMDAVTVTTSSANLQNLRELNTVAVGAADINASGFTLTLSGGRFNTASGSDILANAVQVQSGATVGGTGTVTTGGGGTNVLSGGTVSPGTSPGILNTGNVTFNSGSTFAVEIDGTTAGTGYDQLNVAGSVTLGGATLNLSGSHTPSVGDTFVIVNNDSTDGVTGTFTMGTGGTDANGGTLDEGDTITNFLGSGLNATITYQGGTPNNDVVITATSAVADLSITKSDSPDPVTEGNALTYTLTVSNAGPGAATSVVATDTLPGSVTFVSATASQGSGCTGTTTITCNLSTINNGGNATVTIVVTPNTPGPITNNASVTATESDPNTPNNDSEGTVVNAAVCTSPPAGMVAWYPGDGNPDDIQGPTFENGTLQGGATFGAGKVNQAFSLDGTDDYVEVADSPANSPTGAITIDAWVNPDTIAADANGRTIVSKADTGTPAQDYSYEVRMLNGGQIQFSVFCCPPTSQAQYVVTPGAITPGVFTHVAATFDSTTQQMKVYFNGVDTLAPLGGASVPASSIFDSTAPVRIGAYKAGASLISFFDGIIDEVEIFNTALSSTDIANIYNASFAGKCRTCTTPPVDMVSWWPGEGNANDIGGAHNGSLQGGATATVAGKVGQSFDLPGSPGDVVNVPYASGFPSSSGGFTIDAWINIDSFDPTADGIVSVVNTGGGGGANDIRSRLMVYSSSPGRGGITCGVKNPAEPYEIDFGVANALFVNTWHHVACTVAPNSPVRIYVDGVLVGTDSVNVGATLPTDVNNVYIGSGEQPTIWNADGRIDEVEIFNRALSQTEIAAIANAGNAGKCHTSTVTVAVSPSSVLEDGATNLVYTFTRNGDISAALPVDFTVGGSATFGGPNADYTQSGAGSFSSSSGTVTFGSGSATATVTIDPEVDQTDEPDEDVVLTITSGAGYTIGSPNTATGTITDDDPAPSITIDDVSLAEGSGGGNTSFVFTVSLSNPSSSAVSVSFTTTDNTAKVGDSDYTTNTDTLVIPANTSFGQITVLVGADTKLEPNETFFVDLTGATNGTITDSRGVGTIQNDDAGPTFSIDNVTAVEGNAGTTNFVFTVTKTGVTGERARVDFATADGGPSPATGGTCGGATDYVSQTGTLTFTPAETTKTITVAVCGEMTVEGNETFFVNLSNPVNASITTGQGLGTITNDDTDVSVAVTADVLEDGATNLVYTFTRNPLTPGPITVNFTVGGTATLANNDYTATGADTFNGSSGTVTIPTSSTTATVTIDPTDDTDYEFDENVVLTITSGTGYNIGSPVAATGNIINDDDTIIVTKTADTNGTCLPNDCSLREAINLANANTDFNNIFFDVSGAGCVSGVCTIQPGGAGTATPGTPLPAITTQVVIDGYSQPGSSATLSATSIDAVLGIEIDGSAAGTGADGLVLDTGSDGSTIMGLVINRFDGNGIKVISSTNAIEIIGNFIGTNAAGTAAAANHVGIYINNSPNNIIGCTIPSERNLISGNTDEGIEIYGVSPFNATNNILQGNFIGTDKTGLLDVGNGGAGVKIYDGSNNIIGVFDSISPLASGGNVISGNGGNGVEIAGGVAVATNNTVYGNFIGTDLAGTADISNTGNGVAIYNASQNKVGYTTAELRNVIANNDKAGVLIEEVTPGSPAARDAIRANSIYNNGELGIDLTTTVALPGTGDGVTANDGGDGDPGANTQQNFPVITTADVAGTTVSGTLDSTSGLTFTIDVFDNEPGTCDASGNGEGKTYLGSATAVEGAPGQYTWSLTGLAPLVEGRVITATATDQVGNTSEFSKCFSVFKRVQFAQANTNDTELNTGSHAVNIVVTRIGGSGGTVDVNYTITDGSAQTGDNDYSASPSSGTLHWADGDTTPQNLVVTVNGDNKYEIAEIVNLTLFSPVGAILATPSSATLTIVNDDAPPTLSINDRSINEGTSPPGTQTFQFTVTKAGSTALTATVDFATADNTGLNPATGGTCGGSIDYQSQNNSLSFAPNETFKLINVLVCKDSDYEANELFQVNLSNPGNATISDYQGLGTILNDDAPSTGYVVNSTADTDNGLCEAFGTNNGCTLREAINAANTSATPVSISFEIPATDPGHYYYKDDGSGSTNGTVSQANIAVATTINDAALPADKDPDWPHGWWSIATTSPLPTVIKSVVIDGYSQIAAKTNDSLVAGSTNAEIRIEINGASAGANVDGLTLGSGSNSSIVRGMVINRFLRDSGAGTPAGNGVNLTSGGAQSVTGNFIGTDVSGILDLGNGGAGVACAANNVTVGGASLDAMNLISGNSGDGVAFSNSNSDVVQNNLIGTMANGVTALGNGGNGISFAGAGSLFNTLGGVAAVEGNTIRSNGADGVRLFDAGVGNGIRGNSIYANGSTVNDLGIDLGADGVTANDALDGDTGPNALQNFPVITSAIVTGSTKTITGTLNSTAGATFEIDFYASASCDNGGNGEGQIYLGTTEVTTDGSTGDVSFTFHPTSLTIGQVVTATATSTGAQFNTSEFSACTTVVDGSLGGAAGDIVFEFATYTVNENDPGGMAAITLKRVNGTNGQIQTTFHTTNGSATAPGDYTDSTQTVVFNEGETSKTVNVTIIDEVPSVYEGNETVNLTVDSPPQINAAQRDTEIFFDPHAAVLTITENDPVPSFSIASVTSNEGDSGTTNFDFVITKTGATAVNAQVSYATADQTATGGSCGTAGVDYASQSLTPLTFLPSETTKTVTIQVCGDGTVEFDETFLVNLSNPVNATISSSQGTGTVTNDDCPPSLLVNHAGDTHDSTPGDGVCLDSNQNCTLRAAIEEANALVGCTATIPINFAFAFETIIVLPLGELSVEHNVNINGPTTYSLTIDGNGNHRAFNIASDNTVLISNLTITDCAESAGDGGAILNTGTLTLNSVLVNGNSAVNGGGIASTTNNSLTLINTTISGNNSTGNGGGLYNVTGIGTLTNVTIAYNTANSDSLGSESGGGIFVASGDVTLHNTIVADNLKGLSVGGPIADDIGGNVNAGSSYNVIGTGAGGLTNGGPTNNQVGVASALLKPLQANGGPTQTHALTYKSPAVDTGDLCVLTGCSGSSPVVTIDQRGQTRTLPNDGNDDGATGLDIGAYERQETETRDVPFGFNSSVDIVDVIITFPCVLPCNTERANTSSAQRESAVAPAFAGSPTASLTAIDPAPLTTLTRPPNLVIGNSSSPPLPAFEVTTTASYTPPATLCFYLPSITDPTIFASLRVLHRETGQAYDMMDRTRATNPTDFANKLVCSEVNSFSAFAIARTVTPTAANGTVSGQILDSGGKPVEGAAVRMSGTQNRLTITDAEGNYHFDDVEINGLYIVTPSRANFSFSPAQRSFNQLGASTEATFTGAASGGVLNPLDTTEYFVRQQYVDFLGREPDEAGFTFWVRNIDTCANDFGCREVKRIDTSAAFFLSIEFQQTGYLVYRTYQAAYGDMPNAPVPLTLSEFKPDNLQISNRVVVLQDGWQRRLEINKRTFMDDFVQRRRFITAFPLTMTPTEFVDKLFANAGVPTTNSDYPTAIAEFGRATDTADAAARARALRRVAENGIHARRRFNQAFVLMEYFGYLNRDPNTGRDADFAGYQFWLDKLNRFNGNFQDAEMVKAFLTSIEYRARFPH